MSCLICCMCDVRGNRLLTSVFHCSGMELHALTCLCASEVATRWVQERQKKIWKRLE